ncbi:MAG: RNase P modulator RnpM [Lachnospira sp.]
MATGKKIPQRQCIGCGQMKDKKELIRILKTQDGSIVIDATGKKNGRGAYICPDEECLQKAFKTKGLERSFKMAIDQSIYDELKKELNNIG